MQLLGNCMQPIHFWNLFYVVNFKTTTCFDEISVEVTAVSRLLSTFWRFIGQNFGKELETLKNKVDAYESFPWDFLIKLVASFKIFPKKPHSYLPLFWLLQLKNVPCEFSLPLWRRLNKTLQRRSLIKNLNLKIWILTGQTTKTITYPFIS